MTNATHYSFIGHFLEHERESGWDKDNTQQQPRQVSLLVVAYVVYDIDLGTFENSWTGKSQGNVTVKPFM